MRVQRSFFSVSHRYFFSRNPFFFPYSDVQNLFSPFSFCGSSAHIEFLFLPSFSVPPHRSTFFPLFWYLRWAPPFFRIPPSSPPSLPPPLAGYSFLPEHFLCVPPLPCPLEGQTPDLLARHADSRSCGDEVFSCPLFFPRWQQHATPLFFAGHFKTMFFPPVRPFSSLSCFPLLSFHRIMTFPCFPTAPPCQDPEQHHPVFFVGSTRSD